MELFNYFLVIFILLSLSFIGIKFINQNKKSNIIKLDQYTTEFFINQLNDIINYKTVYYIDSAFGDNFSKRNKITPDIDNDDIIAAHESIINDINETLSDLCIEYLNNIYGEKWLNDYIRIHSLSILLNYTNKTIENLTIENFK